MKKNEFTAHPIHPVLESLVEEIGKIDVEPIVQIDDFGGEIKKLEYLIWCLQKSDSDLLSVTLMDSLNAKLANVQSAATTLASTINEPEGAPRDKNINNQLNSLRNNLENAVSEIGFPRVQQIFRSEAGTAIDEILATSREGVARLERDFEAKRDELNKRLSAFEQSLEQENVKLEAQTNAINSLATENSTFAIKVQNDADAKATQFDTLIEQRRAALSEWQEDIEGKGQNFLTKIENFYRLSADNTLSGRFIQASRFESWSYFILTTLSLVFFVGAIWALLYGTNLVERLFNLVANGPFATWLARISLVAVFLVPAGVFSQQASKHRRASVWCRTLGVRVATLKPYLDEFELDGVKYESELKEILKAFFVSELKVDTDKNSPTIQLGVLENALGRIKNILP